jgi:Family of unknown function (DUF5906)
MSQTMEADYLTPLDDLPPPPVQEEGYLLATAEPLAEHNSDVGRTESVSIDDFYAYMPAHQYIFVPSRELWPASSVNARLEDKKASQWLDKFRAIDQMIWAPGQPMVIQNKLVAGGGWIEKEGTACFNLYLPPTPISGDATHAQPWQDHVAHVYPDEWQHIVKYLGHRVQRPDEKINHALVLGGSQGVGKDTLLEPVKAAVGPWNFADVSPAHLLGRFNGFVKSVILRVSEARDLGDMDRYAFYDHLKVYTAAPPDVLRCDEKHIREYSVFNVCGVIITTNHKTNGIFLPSDDRRHYVAWSPLKVDDFKRDYWQNLYAWYANGGIGHVAAYLRTLDLSGFDSKAPPPKTAAFYDIVDANRAPEDAELGEILEQLNFPDAITLAGLIDCAQPSFTEWLKDRRNRRQIPHRLESAGYTSVRNPTSPSDGLWRVDGHRQAIYAKQKLSERERLAAASELT